MYNILKRSLRSWKDYPSLNLATYMVVILCFSLIILLVLIFQNLNYILTSWGGDLNKLAIYLKKECSGEEQKKIINFLKKDPNIKKIKLISRKESLQKLEKQLTYFSLDLLSDSEMQSFIPSIIEVTLNEEDFVNQKNIIFKLKKDLNFFPEVDDIAYGGEWIKNYTIFVKIAKIVAICFIFVLILTSFFIIANLINIVISNRKKEIEILELIGASRNYIRNPFLLEGALLGCSTVIVGLIINYIFFNWIDWILQNKLSFLFLNYQINFFSLQVFFLMIFGGTFIGLIGSFLCIKKLNNGYCHTMTIQCR